MKTTFKSKVYTDRPDYEGCNENSRCTNGDDAWAETAPLAICRYALKVAGVKINGDS